MSVANITLAGEVCPPELRSRFPEDFKLIHYYYLACLIHQS